MEFSNATLQARLLYLFTEYTDNVEAKIEEVKQIFNGSGASQATQDAIKEFTQNAFDTLDKMNIDAEKKALLQSFGENLMQRKV